MATYDRTEILFNKYKNLPTAYPNEVFSANQAVGDAFPQVVPNTQIWNSTIPSTAPTSLGSVVTFTNGSYQQSTVYSWIRKYTVTMGAIQAPGISYWYASTDVNNPLTTNVCRDTIPFNFDPVGSYNIQVFANGTPVSPTFTAYPWNYDESAGILTFYPEDFGVLPPTPITMTYWRYVGNKGGSSPSYWNITDPAPGTSLNFDYLGTTKAIINSSGNITANGNLITKNLLQITDGVATTNTWDVGSSGGTMYFNYPTAIVDIIQLKPVGSLQLNGSAPSFRVLDRTNSSHWIAWYSISDTLTWEYWNGSAMTNFMTVATSTNTLTIANVTANLNGTASTATQVIQTLFNPLLISNRVLYPAFWFNSLSGGSKALYGDNSISSLLTIRFETGAFGVSDPMFYTPNINNTGTLITTSITAGGSIGTSGQYLSSTGSAISWVTPPTIPTVNNGTLTITNGTFMTGSGTFTANQAGNTSITIGTNATSANTALTIVARDSVNNFSAGTITANLTGIASIATRAQTIDTTTASALTYYLPMVDGTGVGTQSEVLYVDSGLSYAAGTNTLTATTFNGGVNYINTNNMLGSTFYPVCVNTSGTVANQIPWTDANFNYTYSTDTLNVTNLIASANITADVFTGNVMGSATQIDTTQQTTGTYFLTLAPVTTSSPLGQTIYTGIVSYQYLSGTNGVMINRGSYRVLDRSAATSFFWDIFTTTGNALTFDYNSGFRQITISTAAVLGGLVGISRLTNPLYIGNVNGYTGGGNVPLAMLLNTLVDGAYNNIQLGHSSATNKSWFIGARNNTTAADSILSLAPYGTGQTDCWYVDTLGNTFQQGTVTAPSGSITYLTIPQGNIVITDQTDSAKYWTISSSSGNLYFNQTTAPLAIPFTINYDGGGVLIYNQRNFAYAPSLAIEMDTPLTTEGVSGLTTTSVGYTANDYASFVAITNPTSVASGALATFTVQAVNPINRTLILSTPVNVSGTLTGTVAGVNRIFVNMTVITISMTRNGSNFTNFAYVKPTLPLQFDYSFSTTAARTFTQPFFQLELSILPTDSVIVDGIPSDDIYIVKMVTTMTFTVISGGGTFTGAYGGAGFTLNLNTAHTGTGITFNTPDAAVTALTMVKSRLIEKPIASPYYLTSEYTNLVYQRTFTSEVGVVEPLCFNGGYIHYDITWVFSSSPTAFTALSFALATNTGTVLLTGYSGRTAILGDTYSQVPWTTQAFVAYCFNRNWMTYKMTISYPNTARAKVMSGTNNGSANGTTFLDCPHIMSGQNTTATAYPSMYWSVVGTAVNGTISVTGRNT